MSLMSDDEIDAWWRKREREALNQLAIRALMAHREELKEIRKQIRQSQHCGGCTDEDA